ncbi:MAG: dihydroneopterin aldolase [Candidatus Azobacteroides sp.]|nr:dihydroneopterin aldolase [Candidatus Azobacteroides sp.]
MVSYILLENMQFFARHGLYEEERLIGNRFEVNLKIKADLKNAAENGLVSDTINYAEVYDLVAKEMHQPSDLLEHLAGKIIKSLRKQFPDILEIEIKVSKLNPPLKGQIEKASIIMID